MEKNTEQETYPGAEYQRLFNAISDSGGIATQSDMTEIIRIVHEDFPDERVNTFYEFADRNIAAIAIVIMFLAIVIFD